MLHTNINGEKCRSIENLTADFSKPINSRLGSEALPIASHEFDLQSKGSSGSDVPSHSSASSAPDENVRKFDLV
jgi:hypothetical protein